MIVFYALMSILSVVILVLFLIRFQDKKIN